MMLADGPGGRKRMNSQWQRVLAGAIVREEN
jgi:hypothetical protein